MDVIVYQRKGCQISIDEIAARSSFSTTNRVRYFDFIAAYAKNLVSHTRKYDVANGSSTFKAFLINHYIPN